jgi:hypothetical protein
MGVEDDTSKRKAYQHQAMKDSWRRILEVEADDRGAC